MATSYPSGIDSFPNPSGTDPLDSVDVNLDHSVQHSNVNDAVNAIETELGTDPAGSYTDLAARLDAIESYLGTAPVYAGTTPPSSPSEGTVWIDTSGL